MNPIPPTPQGEVVFHDGFGYMFWGGIPSNFTPIPCGLTIPTRHHGVLTVPTVEHAFQAAKTDDPQEQIAVLAAPTPGKAKGLGRKLTLRPDWDDRRFTVMARLVKARLSQDPELREWLLSTSNHLIAEDSPYDPVWGIRDRKGSLTGRNALGLIYMVARDALRR